MIFILQLIHDDDESDKVHKELEDEYGETVLYAPKFDLEAAGIWLSPIISPNWDLAFNTCSQFSDIYKCYI